ncbi:MAG: tRNA preQ1(34) S-adenosylmethionine ribosyltransferase-isomerase QueA [Bacteroidetes bacterium CG2_30_33_31]|nr:MAG: tRNA preQ1(34) S-adenosylmethionine ribosyltransferase-isomerase QueA [Bacteroidetes bacterium CG2_30_33_31]
MKLSQFRYELPEELIAKYPKPNRDDSRLMVVNRKTKEIEHKSFKDVMEYFGDGDLFVLNNTKVFPAKLIGFKEKTKAKIEVFLLRELNKESRLWDALVNPARKIRIGNKLYFGENDELVAEVIDNTTSRGRTLRFFFDGEYEDFKKTITSLGQTPIPLNRAAIPEDEERYQTIYAKHEGAVAAPTAGLHFSRELLKRLEIKGVNFTEITLHPGLGNFRTIEVEDLSKHKMDSERVIVGSESVELINSTKARRKKVVAVGTTTIKALEAAVTISKEVKPIDGWTNLFIFPPYDFSLADALITNFHAPKSPMMMLTATFMGYDFLMKCYKEAIKEKYNFLTYGDAMLIL